MAETMEPLATIEGYAGLLSAVTRVILAPLLAAAPVTSASAEIAATYAPRKQFVADVSLATVIVPVADWYKLLFLTRPTGTEKLLIGPITLQAIIA